MHGTAWFAYHVTFTTYKHIHLMNIYAILCNRKFQICVQPLIIFDSLITFLTNDNCAYHFKCALCTFMYIVYA